MDDFERLVAEDWQAAFMQYASYGEASPKLMYWVGVSTIAACLQRKVWIEQEDFQWTPNFYILLVGEPGVVRKSTSMDVGIKLLRQVADVHIGPSSATWQAFVEKVEQSKQQVTLAEGEVFEHSSMTLSISEFGTFFDPENRELVDVLTDLWDGRVGNFDKATKTVESNSVVNPWINIIAGTTPKWLSKNFGDGLVGGGLASRLIILHGEVPEKDVAYPRRHMPKGREQQRWALVQGLRRMARLQGEVVVTEEALDWGEAWYKEERRQLREVGFGSLEAGFLIRKQLHLHKLAMVIAAARSSPVVGVEHLREADKQLVSLDRDANKALGVVGQSVTTAASREIVEAVCKAGPGGIERRMLYRKQFYRTMDDKQYEAAIRSAVMAELIVEQNDVAFPLLLPRLVH